MLSFLTSLDGASLVAMFWYLIFFEGPRFLIANFTAGFLRKDSAKATGWPCKISSVSIVLPCHNGASGIVKTVTSLREQTFRNLQIVVVDDGSTDNSASIARQMKEQGRIDVLVSTTLRGGKSAALNLGLRFCTGDVIVSADVDTTFDRDAIEAIVAAFDDPSTGAVGGNIGVRNAGASVLANMQAIEYAVGISLGRRVSVMLGILPVVSGAFAAFRREALDSVGGWDAGPGEDTDLTMKLRRAGWRLAFAAEAWALTDAPSTMQALIQQRLRWESDLARLNLRKFRMLLSPWAPHVSLRDTTNTLDVLIFSIVLPFAFVLYVVWLLAAYGAFAVVILMMTGFAYSLIGTFSFLVAITLSERASTARLLPYALGYGFYCTCVLHPIRVWAFVQELAFDRSYHSTFVPTKVLSQMWRF
ncbi:glycosyltransferase [Chelativorans sp. AA-79]|uniref:glycosyltransferase family 2 protein n=1 Tax=Chelativorans sp. AA-79 TaxID=3028735 RepID=UPI0023FA3587|nr:glycosyltransferase [Chelativorans sp. AA-79]WEX09058.1 glycosyltransferase [Chelativorans sp. AA-79]